MTTLNSSKKATVQKVLHRTACFLGGGLVVAYFLLHIALTVSISFDELEKFSALGSSQPLGYYLKKNCLAEHLFIFLGILAEFLLYPGFCTAEQMRISRFRGGYGMFGSCWHFMRHCFFWELFFICAVHILSNHLSAQMNA